ncbi:MAG TPA: amino acid permease [Allosphingosinicella sp.]|jgi:APA family basic amino acid/polyamine antiporter
MDEAAERRSGERQLGFWAALALVVGNVIGSGVYLIPAELAPYGWNAIFGWIVTVAGALCLAFVFSVLARALPQAGGPYVYTRAAFGEGAGFAVAWSYWISVWTANATIALAAVSYLSLFWPAVATAAGLPSILAVGLVWTLTLVNCLSVRAAGRVQLVTVAIKIVPLVVAIAIGAALLVSGEAARTAPELRASDITAGAIAATAALTLWAMIGFEAATVSAGKVRNPERNVPRATLIGTFAAGMIYLFACSSVALLLPRDSAAANTAPFAAFADAFLGPGPALAVGLFAAVSALGALNGWVLVQGELPLALARDGVFPRWFAATNRAGVAVRAQIVSSGLVTLLIAANSSRTMLGLFVFMALLSTAVTLFTYLFCALAALKLRRRGALPGGTALPTAALLGAAYALGTLWGAGREAALWSAALLASGVPVWLLMRRFGAPRAQRSSVGA